MPGISIFYFPALGAKLNLSIYVNALNCLQLYRDKPGTPVSPRWSLCKVSTKVAQNCCSFSAKRPVHGCMKLCVMRQISSAPGRNIRLNSIHGYLKRPMRAFMPVILTAMVSKTCYCSIQTQAIIRSCRLTKTISSKLPGRSPGSRSGA